MARFKKGDPKPSNSGRKKGTPNRVTRAVNSFIAELADDEEVQEAFRDSLIERDKGAIQGYLGVVAHRIGKPRETVQIDTTPNMAKLLVMALQAGGRAAAKDGKEKDREREKR